MPKIKGRKTYKGYISPAPGKLNNKLEGLLSKVYGSCRIDNPGEIKSKKEKCAKIAWTVVKNAKKSKM